MVATFTCLLNDVFTTGHIHGLDIINLVV